MKKQCLWGIIGLGSPLIILAGISPVVGESNKLGGDEKPVIKATETPSFGTEDWAEGMEYSDAVATGTLPAPAR